MVYNTLSRQKELFEPLEKPQVRMYTCGPTVYDYAHIGNFRAYIFEDLLRRTLKHHGFEVTQVMNLTDVDDKTIKGARSSGLSLYDYTQKYKTTFFEHIKTLNIEPAEVYPAATEHISEMIELIEKLFKAGYAYQADDGSVYFNIGKFDAYGRLSHLDMSGLMPEARVAQDEYQKDNAADFALWKAWVEDDAEVGWESPWGRGRPGWHIECSAMSMKYLGASFDLHVGGVDNIFPHHENEIAQSEAATGQPFVKYWMHCAHLIVEGGKMSKSLGNFYTLRDVLERGFSGREIRYTLMAVHYRQTLNFSFDAVQSARGAIQRLDEFLDRLRNLAFRQAGTASGFPAANRDGSPAHDDATGSRAEAQIDWVERGRHAFFRALDDDLNIALALGAMFDMVHEGNKRMDTNSLFPDHAKEVLRVFEDFDRVLGVLQSGQEKPDADVLNLAEERQRARKAKRWAESDRLRAMIEKQGWNVQDTSDGYKLKRIG